MINRYQYTAVLLLHISMNAFYSHLHGLVFFRNVCIFTKSNILNNNSLPSSVFFFVYFIRVYLNTSSVAYLNALGISLKRTRISGLNSLRKINRITIFFIFCIHCADLLRERKLSGTDCVPKHRHELMWMEYMHSHIHLLHVFVYREYAYHTKHHRRA